jgi:catechol 2,3-dioxygenase-like lactoylglutathione lyase family enzyme
MKSIEILSVPVSDQERAKKFYNEQLGFPVIVDNALGNGQRWVQLGLPGDGVTITLVNWFPQMPAGCLQGMVILTDDVAGDVETLRSRGVDIPKIDQTPWGQFANFKDPDGNGWSLHQGR